MTEDEVEEVEEEEEGKGYQELDSRIVKLMEFMGVKDLDGVQQIKLQRHIDMDSGEWVKEHVVMGFTQTIGHANDVKIDGGRLMILPKFYFYDQPFEQTVEEYDEDDFEQVKQ